MNATILTVGGTGAVSPSSGGGLLAMSDTTEPLRDDDLRGILDVLHGRGVIQTQDPTKAREALRKMGIITVGVKLRQHLPKLSDEVRDAFLEWIVATLAVATPVTGSQRGTDSSPERVNRPSQGEYIVIPAGTALGGLNNPFNNWCGFGGSPRSVPFDLKVPVRQTGRGRRGVRRLGQQSRNGRRVKGARNAGFGGVGFAGRGSLALRGRIGVFR